MQILLTRPASQIKILAALVEKNGDIPLLFPSLVIRPLVAKLRQKNFDIVIFISVNAVRFGIEYLKKIKTPVCLATIGESTKKYLENFGFKVNVSPRGSASSAALLATKYFENIKNKHVLIIRGNGGQETLKNSLSKNNTVDYLEVYERFPSHITRRHEQSLVQFLAEKEGIIVFSSVDNLVVFLRLAENIMPNSYARLLSYPVVLFSERIAKVTKEFGFKTYYVAKQISDQGLLQTIKIVKKIYINKY